MAQTFHVETPFASVYRPVANQGDGVLQAWTVHFWNREFFISTTLLISNIGPGEANNGVSLIFSRNANPVFFTAGYSSRSLTAEPGRFGVRIGRCRMYRNNDRIELHIRIPDVEMRLRLHPSGPGLFLDRPVAVSQNSNANLRLDIPVPVAGAEGRIRLGHNPWFDLEGRAGMEYVYADHPIHPYGERLRLLRSFDPEQSIFLATYHGTDAARAPYMGMAVILRDGRIVRQLPLSASDPAPALQNLKSYPIGNPFRIVHAPVDTEGHCKLIETQDRILAYFNF
ncbi:MAG: hypothetical protein KDK27_09915, partial [Leptospiraceae bacterium]|nr:hypothetical protein [Leptospiraceae bacterium]